MIAKAEKQKTVFRLLGSPDRRRPLYLHSGCHRVEEATADGQQKRAKRGPVSDQSPDQTTSSTKDPGAKETERRWSAGVPNGARRPWLRYDTGAPMRHEHPPNSFGNEVWRKRRHRRRVCCHLHHAKTAARGHLQMTSDERGRNAERRPVGLAPFAQFWSLGIKVFKKPVDMTKRDSIYIIQSRRSSPRVVTQRKPRGKNTSPIYDPYIKKHR